MPLIVRSAGSRLARLRPFLLAASLSLAAASAHAENKCSATGVMGGEAFALNHCAIAYYPEQKSVTLWFNESPIEPREAEGFQGNGDAEPTKDGKTRTMLVVQLCPGGGQAAASAAAVKAMDMEMAHANSASAGAQWMAKAPRDFKVESISGDVKFGGNLVGKITGSRSSGNRAYSWNLVFDVTLPDKDSASGMKCPK